MAGNNNLQYNNNHSYYNIITSYDIIFYVHEVSYAYLWRFNIMAIVYSMLMILSLTFSYNNQYIALRSNSAILMTMMSVT